MGSFEQKERDSVERLEGAADADGSSAFALSSVCDHYARNVKSIFYFVPGDQRTQVLSSQAFFQDSLAV